MWHYKPSLGRARSKLGIRLRLEIVGKTNTYTSDIFPCHRKMQPLKSAAKVKDNCPVYEGEDAFLRVPTSFGKPLRYEVLSFACLTVNKRVGGIGRDSYAVVFVSLAVGITYDCQIYRSE